MHVVIIGNGTAGNEVAFSLREMNSSVDITIVSDEKWPEYDPCSLTYYAGGDVPRSAVFRRQRSDYDRAGIELLSEDKAVEIKPHEHFVKTASERILTYDYLVLAYGSETAKPPVSGIELEGVTGCKRLCDADKLHKKFGKSAVVIGSGAIGIESAEALKKRDMAVTVVEMRPWILPALFDRPAGERLGLDLKSHGIDLLADTRVERIEGNERVRAVVTNRTRIECDIVVLATGVTVDTGICVRAGIEAGRGIRVNEHLETNIPGIFACGDCVETFDRTSNLSCSYQLKHNAIDQARIVACNLLASISKKPYVRYQGAYSFARAHFFDTYAAAFGPTLQSLNERNEEVEVLEQENENGYLAVLHHDFRVVGAQAVGKIADRLGLLIGAAWRGDDIRDLRKDYDSLNRIGNNAPWTLRQLGELLGFNR